MASAALRSAEHAVRTGSGTKDNDAKKTMSNGHTEVLGVCDQSASSSDSGDSSGSSSGSSGSSSDSSSDSSDEDDGSASEVVDVVGDSAAAASPRFDGVQDEPPSPSSEANEGMDDDDSDHEQQIVSVGDLRCKSLGRAVRVPHVMLVNKAEFLPKMELQVSPQGRLMQPAPTVRFSNLLDELQYVAWLSFIQDSGVCAGEYMHPESPRPGASWNGKPLSFSKLKLFPYDGSSKTPITLTCNKSYFLQINFGNVDDHGHILASTVIRQAIVGTWFVAVNQYPTKALVASIKKPK